jgi:hypothetical protein
MPPFYIAKNARRAGKMLVNQKAVKVINKIFDAGITEEKEISAMTLDEILEIQGITVAEIGMINDLQKAIKANKVITFLGGGEV